RIAKQSEEVIAHEAQEGEHATTLGGHPSLKIGKLLETQRHNIDEILQESLQHEEEGIARYRKLLELVADRNLTLEEYARRMVHDEEGHLSEVKKMLRPPRTLDRRR